MMSRYFPVAGPGSQAVVSLVNAVLAPAAVVLVLLVQSGASVACETAADCPLTWSCIDGECVSSLLQCDPPCDEDHYCRFGVCVLKPGVCPGGCGEGLVCRDGVCRSIQELCALCSPWETCEEGTCVPTESLGFCPQGGLAVGWDCAGLDWSGCCLGDRVLYCGHGKGMCPEDRDQCLCMATCDSTATCRLVQGFHACSGPVTGQPGTVCSWGCIPDCGDRVCGDDGCGGSCGDCEPQQQCLEGACIPCTPSCPQGFCGDDGCGGTCGCGEDQLCVDGVCLISSCPGCGPWQGCVDGVCVESPTPPCPGGGEMVSDSCLEVDRAGCCAGREVLYCGQGEQCPTGHDSCLCRVDCQALGDGVCGWDKEQALVNCKLPPTGFPAGTNLICPWWDCSRACGDRECGDDGCGGSCGTCPDSELCVDGLCIEASCDQFCGGISPSGCWCDADCPDFKDCCPDRCELCPQVGDCSLCLPDCGDRTCGDDGCGGVCGTCQAGQSCEDGTCRTIPCRDQCPRESSWCSEGLVHICRLGKNGCLQEQVSDCDEGLVCDRGRCAEPSITEDLSSQPPEEVVPVKPEVRRSNGCGAAGAGPGPAGFLPVLLALAILALCRSVQNRNG